MTNIVGTDKTGALYRAEENVYDPFGKAEEGQAQSKIENEIKYTGAVLDNSGVSYPCARHYDANTGRFLQQDAYKGDPYSPWTQNLYTYTGNNPTNYVDPTGHFFEELQQFLIGIKKEVQVLVDATVEWFSKLGTPSADKGNDGGRVITSPIKDVFANEDDAARAANAYAAKLSAQGKTVFEQYEYAYAIYQDDNGRWAIGDFVRGEEPVGNNAGKADWRLAYNLALGKTKGDISIGHTHVVRKVNGADPYYDENKKTTGGLASNADYQIIGASVQIRNFYTGYGNELECLDVRAAKEAYAKMSAVQKQDGYDFAFRKSSTYYVRGIQ